MDGGVRDHWDGVYRSRAPEQRSWTQPAPTMSTALIDRIPVGPDEAVVDVGGGASSLVDVLLDRGHRRITVLDVSAQALAQARARVERTAGEASARSVEWVAADVRDWRPREPIGLWHDRAVFHFLTEPAARLAYREAAAEAVRPGGHVVLGTFAPDGPEQCSGLPVARYAADTLAAEFRPHFRLVDTDEERHHTPWGGTQPFTWVVLRAAPTGEGSRVARDHD